MDAAGRELKIRTHVRDELLDITDEALFDYHLVFMHGRTAFRLTDAERKQLKQYIERGGMLLGRFDLRQPGLHRIVPPRDGGDLSQPQAGADSRRAIRCLSTTYGGFDLRTVTRRDPEAAPRGGPLEAAVRKVPPDLEGIKFGDRWGVIFSPYDLSCAWRSTIRWSAAATPAKTPPGSG